MKVSPKWFIVGVGVVVAVPTWSAGPGREELVRAYMLCVREYSERLEPSGDSPVDIAKAAIFLCGETELAAFNADVKNANQLRETAIFYGAGQAVVARLCRKTKDCGLAPLPGK